MSCASELQKHSNIKGAIVPNPENKTIKVPGFEGRWNILMDIEYEGETRHIVEREDTSRVMVVSVISGEYHRNSGPVSWLVVEDAAKGILFNRGSAVEELKAAAAGFLVLTDKLRGLPKFAHPYPYQNQTDEGV